MFFNREKKTRQQVHEVIYDDMTCCCYNKISNSLKKPRQCIDECKCALVRLDDVGLKSAHVVGFEGEKACPMEIRSCSRRFSAFQRRFFCFQAIHFNKF